MFPNFLSKAEKLRGRFLINKQWLYSLAMFFGFKISLDAAYLIVARNYGDYVGISKIDFSSFKYFE